ncbi:MAG TPA: 3-hydroxyacyl-CoA dehydrogenase NAD-binding domain-containing protein [Thermomicrobiales bacterium]|nr:3-hydroxyacyl-CoA dehydrogenase NAD-binding domain-containing protein [Thermomicrobiales bacterium]
MEITRVGVVGGGTMGNGIVQVMAQSGVPVTMVDVNEESLDRAMRTIRANLQRGVDRERISAGDMDLALGLIETTTSFDPLGDVDLVIEAIPEIPALKKDVFERADEVAADRTILASNTSSIPITMLGAATGRPAKVIGMHFFNPAPVMQLVEIIRGLETDDETV